MRARCGGCWKWISSPSCFEPPHGPHPSLRYGQPVGWLSRSARLDTLHHPHLRQMLDKRIRGGVIRRLIDKWLKAGVMENGELSYPEDEGTPQGGVISPLLSNIYLHEVLDEWFENEVHLIVAGGASGWDWA